MSAAVMGGFADAGLLGGGAVDSERAATHLEGARKKRRYAYLAWLCFGSHYLYLKRPGIQLLFWLTLGGLLLWWLNDLRRIPAMVRRYNLRAAGAFLESWQPAVERPLPQPAPASPWRPEPVGAEAAPSPWVAEPFEQRTDPAEQLPETRERPRNPRKLAGIVIAGALTTAAASYAFSPPPLYNRSLAEPSFRTVRAVNVRSAPSTASRVRATAGKNVVLRGRVEKAGSKQWLWVTRGAHADGYVALHNLEKL